MRARFTLVALAGLLTATGMPAASGSTPKGTERTFIAVGAQATPSGLPTMYQGMSGHDEYAFTDAGVQTFHGPWTGTGRFSQSTTVNGNTLEVFAHGIDVFDGVYLGDNSRGTLTFRETFKLNLYTGAMRGTADIISGDGDPTFRCSSGHFDIYGYINAATGFAGYGGTWIHGCPRSSQ